MAAHGICQGGIPVKYAVPVHVIHGLHELVQVRAHSLFSHIVPPAAYEFIHIHILSAASAPSASYALQDASAIAAVHAMYE